MSKPIRIAAVIATLIAGSVAGSVASAAKEPEKCKVVKLPDGEWTDLQARVGVYSVVLEALGYKVDSKTLAAVIALEAVKTGDADVWAANWMPSMTSQIAPYLAEKSFTVASTILDGAGYGVVVPDYVAQAGVKDFKDLAKFRKEFEGKIYGLEPGNDSGVILLKALADPKFGLSGWELVETSEMGMLAQAQRLMADKQWVAFVGWNPHPVMAKMNLTYLTGLEDTGFGAARVDLLMRNGYAEECPNVGKLFKNSSFTVEMNSELMDPLAQGADEKKVAREWLVAHPDAVSSWLKGVTTFDGGDAAAAVNAALKP